MTVDTLREFLGWCAVINFGVLLVWFLAFALARDFIQDLHHRWFPLPVAHFTTLHYGGMGLFKLGILFFNVAPYLALHLVGKAA